MSARPTNGLRRELLPNGVTLLVQRRRNAPAAALVTYVRAGFLDEPDRVAGVSHVLEHMIFKGTPLAGPGELARQTKALGGALNAYTAYDRTVYFATVPAAHAAGALALQSDAVRNASIDAEELRRELGVIIQEARRKLDSPSAVAGETLHELLFDQHRFRRWRIGTEAALEGFTRDDVAGYHASRYVPGRTIAVLIGDIDEDVALDMLRAHWADWRAAAPPFEAGPTEVSAPSLRVRRLAGDVTQADLVVGWRGVHPLHSDAPALELAAALLSAGRGARLARLLRDPGIVGGVDTSHYGAADVGVFAVGAELEPTRIAEALGVIGGAVRDLIERPAERDELERARTLLRMRFVRGLEGYEGRAIALAASEAAGDVTRLDRREERLLAVTPESLREAVVTRLVPEAAAAVAYFPRQSDTAFDVETVGSALRAVSRRPAPVAPAAMLRRAPGPSIVTLRRTAHAVHHFALPGLDVLTARHGDVPQVTMGVWRGRTELEDATTAGLAALAVRSMLRGTTSRDNPQLALALESLGGVLGASLGADALGFGTTVLSEHAIDAAELLADVLTAPRFDADAVAIERALLADDARAVADDSVRFPFQLALGVAFGDRGYGAPTLGTPASLAALDEATVRSWHARLFARGRTTVVAVGDADPVILAESLAEVFADAGAQPATDAAEGLPRAAIHHGIRTEQRDRQQSAFAMLFPAPTRTDGARYAAETWAAIAGGLGGRLFEALRDRRSLAYTVMASSWQRRHAGALITYIATAPERLEEARDAMLEELELFRDVAPTLEETTRATAMLAGQAEIARQTAGSYASEIADAWLRGEGLIELDEPGRPYRAVTPDEVHAVARRALEPTTRAEGVLDARPALLG